MDQTTFDKFLEKTTKASFHNEVMRMVYAAESDIASQLNEKRGRLRSLLATEARVHAQALYERQQELANAQTAQNYEEYERMLQKRELERQKYVEEKRRQQHFLNCDELRPKLQQALLDDSKRAQLKQIEEKRRLDQVKQDDDDMWLEVDRRAYADRMLREQMEKQVRDERNACNVKILDWQMANKGDSKAAKRNEIEEERRLNAIKMEELKLHDALKKVERKQKQSEYAEECKKLIAVARNAENERKCRDLDYDKMVSQFVQKELAAAEAKRLSDLERRRDAVSHFLYYVEQQRADQQLTAKEEDELFDAYRRQIENEAYQKRVALRERQRLLNEQVYAMQLKQINENRMRQAQELTEKREELRLSQEMHRKNMEMDRAAQDARRQANEKLREELKEQARARDLQMANEKKIANTLPDSSHPCEIGDCATLHPNYRQILSFDQK